MDARATIIEAAAQLLADSPHGDISTRAVCEAAQVQQPALYRLFGDKAGLLGATVDHVWDRYLSVKRAAVKSADPLVDLRRGWDSHTAFALANPQAYRLLFGSTVAVATDSAAEALRLLREVLERLAAEGRLRVSPAIAAQQVMAANTGVALALILRPVQNPDKGISERMRESIVAAILTDTDTDTDADADDPASTDSSAPTSESGAAVTRTPAPQTAAITLRAALPLVASGSFSANELALLDDWLDRIQNLTTVDESDGTP
ncbi:MULTISPECIES: TetR/AcrR family transcriptional regulator [unclassified Salinibacterium]|uniref:TetR/AcrR family transcriptional regulator n=1 Tax=unclassified Salinibacterium TaxID=2632331 RepID=UPI0018CFACB5|nr:MULTISPECIES: TetR/AcrR family transcriptional regulator [unclassified Salinibacterium]MBH0052770.1 TetR/AcrR family transcriptional regulator [Salinibacterium sp. SWN139]MBH0082032.1 TetR/AcrR family transcriptional regulator [Salinibacterium sp. SWN167]